MKKLWLFIKKFLLIVGFFIIVSLLNYGLDHLIKNEIISMLIIYLIASSVIFLIFHKDLKYKPIKNFSKYLIVFIICYLLTILSSVIISALFNVTSANENANELFMQSYPLLAFLITGILAPFYEEVLFRLNFRKVFNHKWPFVIITGIIFGAFHLISATSLIELVYVIPYSIMGMMLGYLYYDSDNIYTSILFHSLNNLIILLQLLIGR